MQLSLLTENIRNFSKSASFHMEDNSISIYGYQYFNDQTSLSRHILYILSDGKIPYNLLQPDETYSFLVPSPDISPLSEKHAIVNLIEETCPDRFSSLILYISELLSDDYKLKEHMCEISNRYFRKEGLINILESASSLFYPSSFVLIDSNFKIISHAPAGHPFLDFLKSEKGLKEKYDQKLRDIQWNLPKGSAPSYYEKPFYGGYNMFAGNIHIENFLVGTLMMFNVTSGLNSPDYQVFCLILQIVSNEMNNSLLYSQSRGNAFSVLLNDVLTTPDYPVYNLRKNLQSLAYNLSDFMRFAAIEPPTGTTYPTFRHIITDIDLLFPDSLYTIYDELIILLIAEEDMFSNIYLDKIQTLQKQHSLSVGLGNVFRDLSKIHQYFRQAVTALNYQKKHISDQFGPYTLFEDIAYTELLNTAAKSYDLHEFCCQELLQLLQYDREHNTDLSQTLYWYLFCFGDVSAVAKKCISTKIRFTTA